MTTDDLKRQLDAVNAQVEQQGLRAAEIRLSLMTDLADPKRQSNEVGEIVKRELAAVRQTLERVAGQQAEPDGSGAPPRGDGGAGPGHASPVSPAAEG